MGGLQFGRWGGCFDPPRPTHHPIWASGWSLESTRHIAAELGVHALDAEEIPTVPVRARDDFRDGRKRAVLLALPRKTVLKRCHGVSLTVPRAHQLGARLDAPAYHCGI